MCNMWCRERGTSVTRARTSLLQRPSHCSHQPPSTSEGSSVSRVHVCVWMSVFTYALFFSLLLLPRTLTGGSTKGPNALIPLSTTCTSNRALPAPASRVLSLHSLLLSLFSLRSWRVESWVSSSLRREPDYISRWWTHLSSMQIHPNSYVDTHTHTQLAPDCNFIAPMHKQYTHACCQLAQSPLTCCVKHIRRCR